MAEIIKINDRISYIKATGKPLSADVGIVEGDKFIWIFDVGADESVPISLNKIQKQPQYYEKSSNFPYYLRRPFQYPFK